MKSTAKKSQSSLHKLNYSQILKNSRIVDVRVIVEAGARREKLIDRAGKLHVSVRERAERNEANTRVRGLLAAHFNVSIEAVRLRTGHRSRKKLFSITTNQ